ncbi:AAA family ATPase [bacterium]|nr:AAA family ATPase [FCB group bacterium]MBL7192297.1 AAA family ATPase [bacterium]
MIEELRLKNFRSFRDTTIKLKPFSVFIGPNGCGKSNLISVFEFIGRAVKEDVKAAFSALGGSFFSTRHIKAGVDDPIQIDISYRERGEPPDEEKKIGRLRPRKFTYHISIIDKEGEPVVTDEWLRAKKPSLKIGGAPWFYLKVDEKKGKVASPKGEYEVREDITLDLVRSESYELILGGGRFLKDYPQVQKFNKFITNWYISKFEPGQARYSSKYSKVFRLSSSGDNLVLVIENMKTYHEDILNDVEEVLSDKIPGFLGVKIKESDDGRHFISIKEDSNPEGFPPNAISDGTIRLLGMMLIMRDPNPPDIICIEEPENNLHPHLLEILVDEFRTASKNVQVIVTTHSPYFIDKCRPSEIFIIDKKDGESMISLPHKWMQGKVPALKGRTLGEQWYEGVLGGNP